MIYFLGNFKKIFLPVLAVAIILVLIYLPKIIGIKTMEEQDFESRYKEASESTRQDSVSRGQEEEQYSEQTKQQKVGIGHRLSSLISRTTKQQSGNSEKTNQNNIQRKPTNFTSRRTVLDQRQKKTRSRSSKNQKNEPIENYNTGEIQKKFAGLNWYRQDQSDLKKAYVEANNTYKLLDGILANSKREVANFIELFDLTIENSTNLDELEENLKLLEKQDLLVLTTMLKEFVPRSAIISWNKVDLSKFYHTKRVQNLKQLAVGAFNPRLQIHSVSYILRKNTTEPTLGNLDKLNVYLVVYKDSLRKVRLYKNNRFVKDLKVVFDLSDNRWGKIEFAVDDLQAIYSIEAIDRVGEKLLKNYRFDKPYSGLNIIKNDGILGRMYIAELSYNFKNNLNFIDKLYSFENPVEQKIRSEFPAGDYEQF